MKPLFIKKNGTVSKVSGIVMNLIPSYTLAEYNALTHKPLFWVRTDEEYAQIPSEDVSYGSGSVKDALDGLNDDVVEYYDYAVSMSSSGTVSPFNYYNSVDISTFASGKRILSAQPIVTSSAQRAIATINNTQTTAYVYGTDSSNIVLRVAAKKA